MAEYIDREAAISIVEGRQKALCPAGRYGPSFVYGRDRERFWAWQEIIDELEAVPAAEVSPVVHGRWIGEGDGYAETEYGEMTIVYDVWECDQCGHVIDDGTDNPAMLPNYCPNCGAKMDKEENDGR